MSAAMGLLGAAAVLLVAAGLRVGSSGRRRRDGPTRTDVRRWIIGVAVLAWWRVGWWAGLSVAAWAEVVRWRVEVGRARRQRGEVAAAVPDLIDLLRLAAAAGLPVASAIGAVADRSPPAVRAGVQEAERCGRLGLPVLASIERLASVLGPEGEGVVAALERSNRTGVPLGPLLDDLARRDRAERRARGRAAAGRLTVHLLFPLVLCTLPAAIALAVVPVLVVSIGALRP